MHIRGGRGILSGILARTAGWPMMVVPGVGNYKVEVEFRSVLCVYVEFEACAVDSHHILIWRLGMRSGDCW